MIIVCPNCNEVTDKKTGYVNRAKKIGLKIYCSKKCSGLARRQNRTKEENKKIKTEYDRERRKKLRDILKEKQKAYNESPAGRAMQRRNREKFKQRHLEYCRSDRYRKWKKDYDKQHRAKKMYGEFWEAAIILNDIENDLVPVRHESKIQKGTYNKSKQRKRHGTYSQKSQGITLGYPSRSKIW